MVAKSKGKTVADMFKDGWVRVRGDSVEAHISATNSVGFMDAVGRAGEAASGKGKGLVTIEIIHEDGHRSATVIPAKAIWTVISEGGKYFRQ
jgi:hypothetical protein